MTDDANRIPVRSADGMTSGILLVPAKRDWTCPLLVCIHGGGCNGGYFDLGPNSTAAAAQVRGMSVLLVNRPGYAANPGVASDRPLTTMAPMIRTFIDEVCASQGVGHAGIVIVGHSMGGAIALMVAAGRGDWPLRAIAVSGIGDEPGPEVKDWEPEEVTEHIQPERDALLLFFGPEGSYSWRAPLSLRRVAEPWRLTEVMEMLQDWPRRWRQIAGSVDVPVQIRLAEHDRLWRSEPRIVQRMADALVRSPAVDAAVLPDGGHLYEIHKRGAELIASQIAFLANSVQPAANRLA